MFPQKPYVLIEVANTHGGDLHYVLDLIDQFAQYQEAYGIKFQPLAPDTLATPDFPWYSVYQKLVFSSDEWSQIIGKASLTKDVWIDVFDLYGVQIIAQELRHIHGIKFQSSVLFNEEVISALAHLDLSHCQLILNIAAQSLEAIAQRLQALQSRFNAKEILLEIGFQAYPTELTDSGLSKIQAISERFSLPIVFADHTDGSTNDAIFLPLFAWQQGARVLEKHVMLSDRPTEYDHFSSLTPERFALFVETLEAYHSALQADFINEREKEYLAKTVMIPVLKTAKAKGDLVNLKKDLIYRRSGQQGLSLAEISNLQQQRQVLATQVDALSTLRTEHFTKARIGAIVACRMKSSRLKAKALLPIGDLPSVEFCLRNVLRFEGLDAVILASSTVEEDAILAQHTYNDAIAFFQGHPEDVMQRYLDASTQHHLDVIVRITADMPFVDNELYQFVLKAHFASGADYTVGEDAAIGVNLELFNVACLLRIKKHFPSAEYSEYMTWYFQNNPELVHIHRVKLPDIFVRKYRLTLDYEEDLTLLNHVHGALSAQKPDYTLGDIIAYLDEHPEAAAINQHLSLRYKTDQALIDLLNEKTKIRG